MIVSKRSGVKGFLKNLLEHDIAMKKVFEDLYLTEDPESSDRVIPISRKAADGNQTDPRRGVECGPASAEYLTRQPMTKKVKSEISN